MADWTDIPQDIAYLILDKLPEIIEHVRFGVVCRYWHDISRKYQQAHSHSRRALPMLLLPSPDAPAKPDPPRLCPLTCLGQYQHHRKLRHPLPFSRFRYCGSSNGWLATQHEDFTVTLVNPFRSELISIHLPYLRADCRIPHDFHITKLIVSPESTPEDYKIVAIFGDCNKVATIKSGEESWAPLDLTNICFEDIIFFENMVYGVSCFFAIVMVDIEARPLCSKIINPQDRTLMYYKAYLIESSSSELYVLGRVHYYGQDEAEEEVADHVNDAEWEEKDVSDDDSDNDNQYKLITWTEKFNVYKLKLDKRSGDVLEMVEANNLEGDTFFVGESESMSFPSGCYPGCKSDSIYFTDDLIHISYYKPNGPEDVGCYNLVDRSIDRFYTMNPLHKKNMSQPIWIVPRLSNYLVFIFDV